MVPQLVSVVRAMSWQLEAQPVAGCGRAPGVPAGLPACLLGAFQTLFLT